MKDQELLAVLSAVQGCSIQRIRRVLYVVRNEVTNVSGPIELTFSSGDILVFDAAPDGEALSAERSTWTDYFAEPLSPDNREYVERSGKWTAFDVSEQLPYSHLIAERLEEVIPVETPEGKLIGATIKTGHCALHVEVESDELFVDIA
jgi:hypothetical protein